MTISQFTREDIISALRDFNKEYNTVSSYLYDKLKLKPSYTIVRNEFGCWNNALVEAGLKVAKEARNPNEPVMAKEEVMSYLKEYISRDFYLMFLSFYKDAELFPTAG